MGKFIKKLNLLKNNLVDKNPRELKKFIQKNKKEINSWLEKYIQLFNECGKETKKGEIQISFTLSLIVSIMQSMKDMPKKHKLIMVEKLMDELEKQ